MFKKDRDEIKLAFENLRDNFLENIEKHTVNQFLPTSPKIDSTSLVLNLGRFLAKKGHKAIIIESNFTNPNLGGKAGVELDRGLYEILNEKRPYENFIIKDPIEKNLDMILAPRAREDQEEFLDIDRLDDIYYSLSLKYDYILLDTASDAEEDDSKLYADLVDGVIVVASKKDFRQKKLKASLNKLEELNAPIKGIITTDN